jgi:hypothetical protein
VGLPNGLFPSGFSTKTLYAPFPSPYALHVSSISLFSILSPNNIRWKAQIIKNDFIHTR